MGYYMIRTIRAGAENVSYLLFFFSGWWIISMYIGRAYTCH